MCEGCLAPSDRHLFIYLFKSFLFAILKDKGPITVFLHRCWWPGGKGLASQPRGCWFVSCTLVGEKEGWGWWGGGSGSLLWVIG